MSTLKALLKDVPVELKELGGIVTTKTAPSKIKREHYCLSGANPIIDQGAQFIAGYTDVNFPMVEKNEYIIFGDHSEHIKYVDFSFIQGADGLKILNSKNNNIKYLYYCFLSFYEKEGSYQRHWAKAKKTLIPIPYPNDPEKSLAIQQEIVRVLDELTSLTNQLTTELESERQNRKKQFEFFREQLFSFEEGKAEWKTLGDIGNVKMCKRIFKNETKDFGDIPFYKIGTFGKTANAYISRELYEDYKEKYSYPNKGDILISAAGTIGRTVVFDGKPAYFQDSNIIWIENNQETIINEYLCHFYKVAKWYVSGGGTIDRLYNDNVRKTKIPVPFPNDKEKSIKEQKRIVKLLDQFDATHTTIEEEITKEIKLRTQQYEYYREKLLSFPQN